jgi:hypothetical protein
MTKTIEIPLNKWSAAIDSAGSELLFEGPTQIKANGDQLLARFVDRLNSTIVISVKNTHHDESTYEINIGKDIQPVSKVQIYCEHYQLTHLYQLIQQSNIRYPELKQGMCLRLVLKESLSAPIKNTFKIDYWLIVSDSFLDNDLYTEDSDV